MQNSSVVTPPSQEGLSSELMGALNIWNKWELMFEKVKLYQSTTLA